MPGATFNYTGETDEDIETNKVHVIHETRAVMGVTSQRQRSIGTPRIKTAMCGILERMLITMKTAYWQTMMAPGKVVSMTQNQEL